MSLQCTIVATKTSSKTAKRGLSAAHKRDFQRWHFLFFGVWDALINLSPGTRDGLSKIMTDVGLGTNGFLDQSNLAPFPSQAVVDKAKRFHYEAVGLKHLRGKTPQTIPPFYAAALYNLVFPQIRRIPRKGFANPKTLRDDPAARNYVSVRTQGLQQAMQIIGKNPLVNRQKLPTNGQLHKWMHLPNGQIASNIVAHILGIRPATSKKIRSRAR